MSTRLIEFTEEETRIGTRTYLKGASDYFPKAEADEYIGLGWAKDPETGETGERKPGAQRIKVENASQQVS